MNPEFERKFDRWILGLTFAINSKARSRFDQNLHGLDELLLILEKIRSDPETTDANEIFGLSKSRGGQGVSQETQRLWMIMLSWIFSMRELDKSPRRAGITSYHRYLMGKLSVGEKALEAHWADFCKAGGGAEFVLYGGLCGSSEKSLVEYLEQQEKNGYRLTLWFPFEICTEWPISSDYDPFLFSWSPVRPGGQWFEANLQWTIHDSDEHPEV